jgi:hypothetical protein
VAPNFTPRGWLGVAISGALYYDLGDGVPSGDAASPAANTQARLITAITSYAPPPPVVTVPSADAAAAAEAVEAASMDAAAVGAWLQGRGLNARICAAAVEGGVDGLVLRGLRAAVGQAADGVSHAIAAAAALGLRPLDAYALFAALQPSAAVSIGAPRVGARASVSSHSRGPGAASPSQSEGFGRTAGAASPSSIDPSGFASAAHAVGAAAFTHHSGYNRAAAPPGCDM